MRILKLMALIFMGIVGWRIVDGMSSDAISMGIGAVALLGTGAVTQGVPDLSLQNWLIIAWLAVVNTAFAFTVWNQTQRTLSAVESSILNGTMMVQIALLAWLFLDESLTWQGAAGMVFVAGATVIVQLRPKQINGERNDA